MNIHDFINSISHPEYIEKISIHISGTNNSCTRVFTTEHWQTVRDEIILSYGCRKIDKLTLYATGRVYVYIDVL